MLIQSSVEVDRTHLQRDAQVHCMCQVVGAIISSHEDQICKLEKYKQLLGFKRDFLLIHTPFSKCKYHWHAISIWWSWPLLMKWCRMTGESKISNIYNYWLLLWNWYKYCHVELVLIVLKFLLFLIFIYTKQRGLRTSIP